MQLNLYMFHYPISILKNNDLRFADPDMSHTGISLNHMPFWLKILRAIDSFTIFSLDE